MVPSILYLNAAPNDLIHGMKLAGIRRYAAVRGWEAVAIPPQKFNSKGIAALLAAHRPVAGIIVEATDDKAPLRPSLFGAVPVVYLHPPHEFRDGRIAYVATDNEAVARAAFRELSARRPAAYAVVGYRLRTEWSITRMRVFAELAAKAHVPCSIFNAYGQEVDLRTEEGAAALARWVVELPRHTAIFAVNDGTAGYVQRAAQAVHRHIPRELTLCGVDNLAAINQAQPQTITSIQIDFERAGFLAARMLGGSISHRGTETQRNMNSQHPRVNSIQGGSLCGSVALCDKCFTVGPLMAVWRESTGGAGRREPHIMAAVERIRREACDGLTARKVIEESPGSKRLFTLRFREATGHSVLDEIRHVRMEKVETLLLQTDTPIGAIADMCGWRSSVALQHFFHARTGMGMREWRRKNRG